jgi:nitroreductase
MRNNLKLMFVFISFFILTSIPINGMKNPIKDIERNSYFLGIDDILLPSPIVIETPLEEIIMQRMSMRSFTQEAISDEELSTILWSAYGLRDDGELTVPKFDGKNACVIYVIREDAVYTYNPEANSLVFYKEGDYRSIVGTQYEAPVQLGLCWNTDIADANIGCAELGAIGQNIYFAAIGIGLGTVATAEIPPAINPIGLPENHHGMAVMPLGHPEFKYNYQYRPMLFSLLPRIKNSNIGLTEVFENRKEVTSWNSEGINRADLSHLIWASYGYSYYLDKSDSGNPVKRHHTVPSAHGYYPLQIYALKSNGISQYIYGLYNIDTLGLPVVSFLLPRALGDKRNKIAEASESFLIDAPLSIIIICDIKLTNQWDDLSDESLRWIWYYEAGAAAHNILLQATSRGLSGNIVTINNKSAICSVLKLNQHDFDPMLIVPVG